MRIFKPVFLLTTACALMLSGCGDNKTGLTQNPNEQSEVTESADIDYSKAPSARTWYMGNDGDFDEIPLEAIDREVSADTPTDESGVPLNELGNPIETYTSQEVERLDNASAAKVLYDGKSELTFVATDADKGVVDFGFAGKTNIYPSDYPYLDVTTYVTDVVIDDSVKHLGRYVVKSDEHPISVTVPATIESMDAFIGPWTIVDSFHISGEITEDTKVKVVENGLYFYNEDRGGWELVRYATGTKGDTYKLPDEIDVVYIHELAFHCSDYLLTIDLSANPNIELAENALATTYINNAIVAEGFDTDALAIKGGGTSLTHFTIGGKTVTCEDLGYAPLEPTM